MENLHRTVKVCSEELGGGGGEGVDAVYFMYT